MPQFNIYKIQKNIESDLKKELAKISTLENSISVKGFQIDFYLNFEKNEMWWIDYYSKWISPDRKSSLTEDLQNKSYFGAVVLSNKNICYTISLGKTHFYIRKYCEYDFGIRFARNIIDKNNVTLLNSNTFGGNKIKSINSFSTNSSLEPESGEAIMSIKGGTMMSLADGSKVDDFLGAFISCGDSISISLEEFALEKLPDLILFIEKVSKEKALFDLPTSRKETDPNICKKLDEELAQKILQNSNEVNFSEIPHSDCVGFLCRGDFYIKYLLCKRTQIEINDGLFFNNIKKKFIEKGIDYNKENILASKVKVQNQFGVDELKPIKYFLDYVNSEKYYLNEGHWHHFNQKYMEFIDNSIDLLTIDFKTEYDNPYKDYNAWLIQTKSDKKVWYFEKYFNEHIMTKSGFTNIDRKVSLSHDDEFRRYKLEIADSLNGDLLAFVKRGTCQTLNYVVDQSLTSFKYLQERNWQFESEGIQVKVKRMCLVLIFERHKFSKMTEIESLILKIKLNEWRKKLIGSNIEPLIWCSFSDEYAEKAKIKRKNKKIKKTLQRINKPAVDE